MHHQKSNQNGVPAEFSNQRVLSMKLTFSSVLLMTVYDRMEQFNAPLESPAGEPLQSDERSLPLSALCADDFR